MWKLSAQCRFEQGWRKRSKRRDDCSTDSEGSTIKAMSGPTFPKLPPNLCEQLSAIAPSRDSELEYYPCDARLHDGRIVERVYVVSQIPYIKHWGVYPADDSGKRSISISDVASLSESTSRLPPKFANVLYMAGESGMGYSVFTVVFSKRFGLLRRKQTAYLTGNAVDFIDYPNGLTGKDVKEVLPHVGRDAQPRGCPKYSWCIYSE